MPDFNEVFEELKDLLGPLAEDTLGEFKDDALEDGKSFINKIKADLEEWSKQLAEGKITADEFKWLINSKKGLAEMELLKQKGLAIVKIDKFKSGLLNLVITTVASKLGP